jgi:hypothetical protein
MDSRSFDLAQDRLRGNDKEISVLIGVNPCLYGRLFEKTKPICAGIKERKVFYERRL